MPDRPHILLICTDEQAPQYMGCMGDPIARTPNFDRLAARGALFTNAYCNNPICVPGRYSIMTGRYARDIGSLRYGDGLDPTTWTYPKHFAAAGYQTTCVGKMHFMGLEQMHGWLFRPYGDMELLGAYHKLPGATRDPYADIARPGGRSLADWVKRAGPSEAGFIQFDNSVTRESMLHLRDYFDEVIMPTYSADRPLMFQVSYKTPHWPFWAPPELFAYYRERVSLPRIADDAASHPHMAWKQSVEQPFANTEDEILNARAANYGLIEYVDGQIGQVLDTLEDLGVLDEFLVVMHCDHGEMAGNHGQWGKACAYEHSVRVPMMVSWPGHIPAGRVIDANVSNLDIYPTLCDYARLDQPPGLRGDSLRPLIDSQQTPEHFRDRVILSEFFAGNRSWVMAKRGHHKLIEYEHDGEALPSQLFDLATDPQETANRAGDTSHAQTQKELSAAIAALPEPFTWDEPAQTQRYMRRQ